MGPAADDFYMPDREVVIVPEMRAKMCVVDAAHVFVMPPFFMPRLIVPLFLPGVVVVVVVSVLVLSQDGERSSKKYCSTNTKSDRESFHSDLNMRFFPSPLFEALPHAVLI